jgi:hypothetical protein
MVSVVVCGIATALTKLEIESSDVTPARSMVAARILMMSLVARYPVLRGCGAG